MIGIPFSVGMEFDSFSEQTRQMNFSLFVFSIYTIAVDSNLDFWSNLQLALQQSLPKEISETIVKETSKEWRKILNSLSLDDIERLAISISQQNQSNNNSQKMENFDKEIGKK
jgi:hypothetical protein